MTQDALWKKILDELFQDFLAFFFPKIYQDVDFSKGHQFLDKELSKIIKDSSVGKKIVDKLIKVYLKDGSEKWLLIHLEIQGYSEKNFPQRMFTYNYRIFDKYQKEVISLAVLTDPDKNYRPSEYRISRWGFNLIFQFPIIKLIEYRERWDELSTNKSPFSFVVMAYLKTLETKGNDQERYSWKKHFLSELFNYGMDRKTLSAVYNFIDWLMTLPKELDDEIYEEVIQIEKEHKMATLSTAERIGREKGVKEGRKEGLIEGLQKAVIDILLIKFGEQSVDLQAKILTIANIDILETLRAQLKQQQSVEGAEKAIEESLKLD